MLCITCGLLSGCQIEDLSLSLGPGPNFTDHNSYTIFATPSYFKLKVGQQQEISVMVDGKPGFSSCTVRLVGNVGRISGFMFYAEHPGKGNIIVEKGPSRAYCDIEVYE